MTSWKSTGTSVAVLSLFMTGSAAFAEVTAQQVWDDWKSYMTGFDYQLSANESLSGDTLTVSDIAMTFDIPEDEGTISVNMDKIDFTNNGDGTVSVSIPPVMPLVINVRPSAGMGGDVTLDYTTTGYTMNVSGDPGNMTYNYSVAEIAIVLGEIVVGGQAVDVGSASISVADVIGSSNMQVGNLRKTSEKFDTGAISFALDFSDPEGDGRLVMNGDYNGMSFEGDGSFPIEMDMTDITALLAAGFAFDGGFSMKGGSASFNFQENDEIVQGSSSSDGGYLEVAMDSTQLHYAGGSSNLNVEMAGGDIPFPIQLALGDWAFNLQMPIAKSDTVQDFAFAINFGDFTMSDMIWGIFDPGSSLPHDPATIAIDISGKAKLFYDLMDVEKMTGAEIPGEMNSLNLNSLVVSAAGAKLTGEGAFTFDNSDLTTFDGIPAPSGAIDLKLVGGNGLLDKLIAMGLLPEDQVMGMRMMMGLFAVAGDGEDTLTSKIEVTADGQIKANGQRLK